jgi:hypothetical protein
VAHRVIRKAGEPAAEARQTGARRGAVTAQELADERERIAIVPLDDDAVVVDLDRGAARADADLRRQPDERVATEPLAADDRFQQERPGLVGELDVEGKRGVEVGERLEDERDAVIALAASERNSASVMVLRRFSNPGRMQSRDCRGHR